MATQSFMRLQLTLALSVDKYSHEYNSRTINYPSFPVFVICGHISCQKDSSQRVILDLSNYLWHAHVH